MDTYVGDAKQGNQECSKCCGEGEQFPVPFEKLEIICEARNDSFHPPHLRRQTGRVVDVREW